MFEGEVRYNVGYCANLDEAYDAYQTGCSDEEITQAAKLADADKFIRDKDRFPDGYGTS